MNRRGFLTGAFKLALAGAALPLVAKTPDAVLRISYECGVSDYGRGLAMEGRCIIPGPDKEFAQVTYAPGRHHWTRDEAAEFFAKSADRIEESCCELFLAYNGYRAGAERRINIDYQLHKLLERTA